LQHLYGERYRLELRAAQGGGALAELAIPFHTQIANQEALR
jgi:hypothetical protein